MATALLTPNAEADPLELLDRFVDGIYLAREGSEDLLSTFTSYEDEYASSPDSEGAFPVRSKPLNVERPGRVWITGASESALEDNILLFQQTMEAVRRNGGELTYTSDTGEAITLEVWKASIQRVGTDQVLRESGRADASFVLTCAPYALLPASTVNITAEIGTQTNATTVTSTKPLLSFIAPDPGGSVPAKVKLTVTDEEGVDRSHLEGGVDKHYDSTDPAPLFFDTNPAIVLSTSAAADDIIDTASAHGFSAGDKVRFLTLTGGTNLSTGVVYYVIAANLAAQTFQVSTTSGGAAVNFTSDITAGTVIAADDLGPLGGVATSVSGFPLFTGQSTATGYAMRATLTSTPLAICGSGPQVHAGGFRHKVRMVRASTSVETTVWVRLAFKVGSSPRWRENDWVELPRGPGAWYELDLGLMQIPEPVQGTQTCEWRVEAYSESSAVVVDVDYDLLIPAGPYFKARMPLAVGTPTTFVARDEFDQSAGNLHGKAAAVGGNYATAGATTDLAVSGSGTVTRATTSDSLGGRTATLTVSSFTAIAMAMEFKLSAIPALSSVSLDLGCWNGSSLVASARVGAEAAQTGFAATGSGGSVTAYDSQPLVANVTYRLVFVRFGGRVYTLFGLPGHEIVKAVSTDSMASMTGLRFVDTNAGASAVTRTYDNLATWVPTLDFALNSGRDTEVRSDQIIREHSSGEWGRLDSTGGYPTLNPGRESRIAIKARRSDTDEMPDDVIDDSISVICQVTPRVPIL